MTLDCERPRCTRPFRRPLVGLVTWRRCSICWAAADGDDFGAGEVAIGVAADDADADAAGTGTEVVTVWAKETTFGGHSRGKETRS